MMFYRTDRFRMNTGSLTVVILTILEIVAGIKVFYVYL